MGFHMGLQVRNSIGDVIAQSGDLNLGMLVKRNGRFEVERVDLFGPLNGGSGMLGVQWKDGSTVLVRFRDYPTMDAWAQRRRAFKGKIWYEPGSGCHPQSDAMERNDVYRYHLSGLRPAELTQRFMDWCGCDEATANVCLEAAGGRFDVAMLSYEETRTRQETGA